MKPTKWLIAFSFAVPLVASSAYADDRARFHDQQQQILQMDDLPASVRATVRHEARDRDVESIQRDFRDGHAFYSVEIVRHGKGEVLDISESGRVLDRHDVNDQHERNYR